MVSGVSSVPQCIPQPFTRPFNGVNQFQLDSGFSNGCEWIMAPAGLPFPLPHHHVEFAVRLEAENESDVVIVSERIDKEGAFEVNTLKSVLTDG